jgi:hypothetical protein
MFLPPLNIKQLPKSYKNVFFIFYFWNSIGDLKYSMHTVKIIKDPVELGGVARLKVISAAY